jgi:hypothetical protein
MNLLLTFKTYRAAYIAALAIMLITVYSITRFRNVEKNGVITICKIDRYEAASDGSDTYCTLFFNDTTYSVIIGTGSKNMVGKYFFAKILADQPQYEIIVYDDKEVPDCLLKNKLPKKGWNKIPTCFN